MAQSSKEWSDYEQARDMWEESLISLERAKAKETKYRWDLNDKARKLENKAALEVKE